MEEDLQRAMKEVKDYDGQRISVSVAKKKQQDQKKAGENKTSLTSCLCKLGNFALKTEPRELLMQCHRA